MIYLTTATSDEMKVGTLVRAKIRLLSLNLRIFCAKMKKISKKDCKNGVLVP